MRLGIGDLTPTAATCLPYQCGSDPGNLSARYACAIAGFSAVKPCTDPDCQPYCPNQQITPFLSPPYQPPATPAAPAAPTIVLTPYSIVQPFPDITRTLQPVIVESCSAWGDLNGTINDHNLIAIGVLAGLYLLFARIGK